MGPAYAGPSCICRAVGDQHQEWYRRGSTHDHRRSPFGTDVGPVDDCYALNVDGETAWAYYYRSFPIVRITDGAVTAWRTEVAGATGILNAADACALLGGHRSTDSDRLIIGQLVDGRYEFIDELRLTMPDGQPMPTASFVCRGPDLHAFIGRSWYRLALDNIV